ncbi:MAG: hypothetical protein KGJ62_11220 [Armatimonadetes bacterium]|nr:hypothetical protein [Armatimonadota bacterium]MDE2206299.1 hypothetical protein [Armatimonadota bacterium]
MPWWATAVLLWLGLAQAIFDAPGEAGEAARYKLKTALYGPALPGYARGPAALYRIYEELTAMA